MSFYNSTNATQPELNRYRQAAINQETRILVFFQSHRGILYTPTQINQLMPQAPITSIRRALSNLTKDGWLVKTSTKRQGEYGRPEHCWMCPRDERRAA